MIRNGTGKPVVALDIDGTMGDFHGNFYQFAELYFGRKFDSPLIPNPGLPLWEHMGLEQAAYREAKLAYRQGGWKRWMPAYPGGPELTRELAAAGAEVWICTTRPYLRLDNIDPDTREWLARNRFHYDAVLFDPLSGGNKYDELARQAGNRVASVVDDLPEMVEIAFNLDLPGMEYPILRDQPYNRHIKHPRRAFGNADVRAMVFADLELWEGLQ